MIIYRILNASILDLIIIFSLRGGGGGHYALVSPTSMRYNLGPSPSCCSALTHGPTASFNNQRTKSISSHRCGSLSRIFTLKTWRRRGAKTYKAYLVVSVCFSTSAVHLWVTTDYLTGGFLIACNRFINRRGICTNLYSDCGTNFVGADVKLKLLSKVLMTEFRHLANTLATDGSKWSFNLPAALHFGGKWEPAVKSSKFHLFTSRDS